MLSGCTRVDTAATAKGDLIRLVILLTDVEYILTLRVPPDEVLVLKRFKPVNVKCPSCFILYPITVMIVEVGSQLIICVDRDL